MHYARIRMHLLRYYLTIVRTRTIIVDVLKCVYFYFR
jgi:hypothetical protein